MKRILILILVIGLIFSFSACKNEDLEEKIIKDKDVLRAIDLIKENWVQIYDEDSKTDGYFEIKNTRIINIKDNNVDMFKNVDRIVEFEIYSDYFGSAPYYSDVGINDSVTIYKDGTFEVNRQNPINLYRGYYFISDYSDFIGSIEDYDSLYNCVEKLK